MATGANWVCCFCLDLDGGCDNEYLQPSGVEEDAELRA
jgi:hypothetical protein